MRHNENFGDDDSDTLSGLSLIHISIDVALITLSPPDERGYCSYGVTVDYTKCITECAKLVIAQINRYMPRTYGDTLVHIDDIDPVSYTHLASW